MDKMHKHIKVSTFEHIFTGGAKYGMLVAT